MAPFQITPFVVEVLGDQELERLGVAWQTLVSCENYEWDSPINLALRVAAAAAIEEQWRRSARRGRQS